MFGRTRDVSGVGIALHISKAKGHKSERVQQECAHFQGLQQSARALAASRQNPESLLQLHF